MTHPATDALQQALAFLLEPVGRFAPPLPDDVRPLLRIAAADNEAIERAVLQTGEPAARLRDAASLFLQTVLFAEEGDSYRILGTRPDASDERLREHYRWLVRWLHPDRNRDDWEAEYLYRVNKAWQDLRTDERRRTFDARRVYGPEREQPPPVRTGIPSALFAPLPRNAPSASRLPRIVLGAIGTGAICSLIWLHATQVAVEDFARVVAGASPRPVAPATISALSGAIRATGAGHDGSAKPLSETGAPGIHGQYLDSGEGFTDASISARVAPEPQSRTLHPPRRGEATRVRSSPANRFQPVEAPPPLPRTPSAATDSVPSLAPSAISHEESHVADSDAGAAAAPLPQRPAHSYPQPLQPPPAPLDKAEAHTLVSRFGRAYEAGDVSALAALLTRIDAGSRERREMLREYRRLFRASRQRRIELSRISVVGSGDTGAVIANFSTSMIEKDASRHDSSGDIRFDLLREGDALRIHQVRHEARSD